MKIFFISLLAINLYILINGIIELYPESKENEDVKDTLIKVSIVRALFVIISMIGVGLSSM